MATWEFLLQKKGDTAWLPLESPNLEILEGEYRLAVKTIHINTPVQISITHSQKPQQQIQQVTNSQGFLLVVPFQNFAPGTWQIQCDLNNPINSNTTFPQFLWLEVLPSEDWCDEEIELDPLTALELAELDLVTGGYVPRLPKELIALHQCQLQAQNLSICGEAFISGVIEINVGDRFNNVISSTHNHSCHDSDFFEILINTNGLITDIWGEVTIRPQQKLVSNHTITQSFNIIPEPVVDPFKVYPVLPFEDIPTPARPHIQLAELPKFIRSHGVSTPKLATPSKPLPQWLFTIVRK